MKRGRPCTQILFFLAFSMTVSSAAVGQTPTNGFLQSTKVALVPSAYGSYSGAGVLPTSGFTGGFAPVFTNLSPTTISASTLANFDTVVFYQFCNVATALTQTQKSAVNDFVSNGGKLIIYDSDACNSYSALPNYNWLPAPFTTANPGQLGARGGSLVITEDNKLSSSNSASPYFINTATLVSSTDAVGDMNVMVTLDPRWCKDISGTNAIQKTGPVHAYTQIGRGLIIYNGLDTDFIGYSTDLKKLWQLELQHGWNSPLQTYDLPCLVSITSPLDITRFGNGSNNSTSLVAEPVNAATGNYFYRKDDVTLPGRGMPLIFSRSYNSKDPYAGPLGHGWTHSFNIVLTESSVDGSVQIKQPDGHADFYGALGGGQYVAQFGGVFDSLIKNPDGTFKLTKKDQTIYLFSSSGQLMSIQDKNGNVIVLINGPNGVLLGLIDTAGRPLTFSYNASNLLTRITDVAGRTWSYGYDLNGDLVSSTDANGGVTQYSYDTSHRLVRVVLPNGNNLLVNSYDATGRVIRQEDGKGNATPFAYDTSNVGVTTITDARGSATLRVHDGLLRLIEEVDPNGNSTTYTYDSNHNRTSIVDKNGTTTLFTYDNRGNVTSKTDPLGNVTTITYDSLNNPLARTDALGNMTSYSYDSKGNLTQITGAMGNISRISYDSLGEPVSLTDARGNVTGNTFDAQGNLIRVTDAAGAQTNFTYDVVGRRTGLTNARGYTTSFAYDNNNMKSATGGFWL